MEQQRILEASKALKRNEDRIKPAEPRAQPPRQVGPPNIKEKTLQPIDKPAPVTLSVEVQPIVSKKFGSKPKITKASKVEEPVFGIEGVEGNAITELTAESDKAPEHNMVELEQAPVDSLFDEILEIDTTYEFTPEIFDEEQEELLIPVVIDEDYTEAIDTAEPDTTDELMPEPASTLLAEFEQLPEVAKLLIENLERVEPERAKEALDIVNEISGLADKIYELHASGIGDSIEAEQELVDLCKQLLECLGMETDKEAVMFFIESMVLSEQRGIRQDVYLDRLGEGTHEQKLGHFQLLSHFARLINQRLSPFSTLGKFALQLNASENSKPIVFATALG